jgi:hypothetical protein
MKRITQQNLILVLAGLLTLQAEAVSSIPDQRPRPEEFASFSLYLQALFDYQRTQGRTSGQAARNPSASNTSNESLDQAIANAGRSSGYVDTSSQPRSTFKSFSLAQISPQDMSQSNIADALGVFGDHGLEQIPMTGLRMQADSDLHLTPDVEPRLAGDIKDAKRQEISNSIIESFSGYIVLPEGEAYTSASVTKSTQGDNGLDLTLSTKVRSNVYIIDRDGLQGIGPGIAGAVAIRPLALEFSNLTTHITAARSSRNEEVLSIQSSTESPIVVDLSGSRFGVANASEMAEDTLALDGSRLGPVSYFASFGDNAFVTIAGGTHLDLEIGRPDGMQRPFATINGKIPTISLESFNLLEQADERGNSKVNLSIGKMEIAGLELKDMRLYFNQNKIVIETGTGSRNMSVSMERVAIGQGSETSAIGDIYIQITSMPNMRVSIASH